MILTRNQIGNNLVTVPSRLDGEYNNEIFIFCDAYGGALLIAKSLLVLP